MLQFVVGHSAYALDYQCIRVVTPDDHVTCGYHEILLHDMGEE